MREFVIRYRNGHVLGFGQRLPKSARRGAANNQAVSILNYEASLKLRNEPFNPTLAPTFAIEGTSGGRANGDGI